MRSKEEGRPAAAAHSTARALIDVSSMPQPCGRVPVL